MMNMKLIKKLEFMEKYINDTDATEVQVSLEEKQKSKKATKKYPFTSMSYTTGDIQLNIDHFNDLSGTNIDSTNTDSDSCALAEAKRETKRYYIRPQNIFCASKGDILTALASLDQANCSIYSLSGLSDHDDVHLLTPKDIIYYYDEGVLYDKNHVQVLNYDLSPKKEEERKKQNIDTVSDSNFKANYEDRIVAEDLENPFKLAFDNFNAYGEQVNDLKEAIIKKCCICGEEIDGYGNNPEPYKSAENGERCCDECNLHFVLPLRLQMLDSTN